jgi:RimJ/RimL family protein N-acetyltransferase
VDHILTTERLTLRPVAAADAGRLLAHWTDPDVRRFLFDGVVLSPAQVAGEIAVSARSFAESGYGLWIISITEGADLIGTAGLRQLEETPGSAAWQPPAEQAAEYPEVVYSLAPGAWGKGYATEAARAVVDYALGPLGLPAVLAEVDEGNTASIAIIERLGMRPYTTVPGELGPMIRYRRTRLGRIDP